MTWKPATGRQGASRETVQRERLSEEGYMYCVYWIRSEFHTNCFNEGYIGITKNFKERMKAHGKNKKVSKLVSAKVKYGWDNLVKEILTSNLSLDQALQLEEYLRPIPNIGWNHQKGGELGVDSSWYDIEENKAKHSKQTSFATKVAIAEKDSKEARSNRARKNWENNSSSYARQSLGSKNPRAILNEDDVHFIKYTLLPFRMKDKEIAQHFGVKDYVISFIRKNKNWSHI